MEHKDERTTESVEASDRDPYFKEVAVEPPDDMAEILTPPRVIARFFLIPLALVGAVLGIYLLFGWFLGHERSPRDFVRDLRSPSASTREHALYDLTYYLQHHKDARSNPALIHSLVEAYRKRKEYQPEIRAYLAMALGYLDDPSILPLLEEGLNDEDRNTRFYSLWSLAKIGDSQVAPSIVPLLDSKDSAIREIAAMALGKMAYKPAVDHLVAMLNDPVTSVRINVVFALAQLNEPAALPGLRQLSDPNYLRKLPAMNSKAVEGILLNIIELAPRFPNDRELVRHIQHLARKATSMAVRNAAMKFMSHRKDKG